MSKLLISKKGRAIKPLILVGLICALSGVALIASGEIGKHGYGNSEFEDMLQGMLPFLILFGGAIIAVGALNGSKTRISVYDDHVEGVGLGKAMFGLSNFHFTKDMHYTLQQSGSTIKVSCGSETYNIPMSGGDAAEVYRCAKMGTSSQTPRGPVSTPKPQPQRPTGTSSSQPKKPVQPPVKKTSAEGTKIIVCPQCRAQLRVPTGKGTIRVTCPKCRGKVETNT